MTLQINELLFTMYELSNDICWDKTFLEYFIMMCLFSFLLQFHAIDLNLCDFDDTRKVLGQINLLFNSILILFVTAIFIVFKLR